MVEVLPGVIFILYSFDHLLTGFNPDEVVVHQPQKPAVDPDNDLAAAAIGAAVPVPIYEEVSAL